MKKGLVLEGGAMKGSYQIGAYYAFRKCGIKFKGYAGTSIGAFNAAMLAVGKHKELLEFWTTIESGKLLGADEKLIEAINYDRNDVVKLLTGSYDTLKKWIKNKGIPVDIIKKEVSKYLDAEKLINNKIDYGLVTVKLKGLKPIYVTKEDITPEQLLDYIQASSYLPIFKMEKIIDNNIYIDGGFYDNSPTKILLDKDYDKIYNIGVNAPGLIRKLTKKEQEKIIDIYPSRNICKVMEMNHDQIRENIQLGYYDTLRAIKNYDGYKYTYRRKSSDWYERKTKNIPAKELKRVKTFFDAKNTKEAVIKAVEYLSEKKYYDYYQTQDINKVIKKLKKSGYKEHFVYTFITKLK